jgi:hypothetical protein
MNSSREDKPEEPAKKPKKGFVRWLRKVTVILVLVVVVGFALWTWVALTFVYSNGDRAGYVQKFSKKGWIFKTWEGELAMVNLPGAMPEIFSFSVKNDGVAQQIQQSMGKRVRLHYEQHIGIPVSWFGETQYFVVEVVPAE